MAQLTALERPVVATMAIHVAGIKRTARLLGLQVKSVHRVATQSASATSALASGPAAAFSGLLGRSS
jgi:hypothetical protein